MMKKFLTLAVAALAFAGVSASAQDQAATVCRRQNCENAVAQDRMRRPATWREYAFEGVLLSVDQQGKIDQINKDFDARRAAACKRDTCTNPNCTNPNCTKATCDSVNCKNAKHHRKHGNRHGRDGQGVNCSGFRKEYIAKVKEVLTPEQYTTFLENIVNMPGQVNKDGRDGRNRFDRASRKCRLDSCAARGERRIARDGKAIARDGKSIARDAKKDARKVGKDVKKDGKKVANEARKAAKDARKAAKKAEKDLK